MGRARLALVAAGAVGTLAVPSPPPATAVTTSVERPSIICSGPACVAGPRALRSAGCLARSDVRYDFALRLRRSQRHRLRVIRVRFTLDWKPAGVDRRAPAVARVGGSTLAPGEHLLLADVRLRSRRTGKSSHRRVPMKFYGCE